MLNVIGTVLDRLQGLFGKRFLVAGLAPVLVLVVLSAAPALHVVRELPYIFDDLHSLSPTYQILAGFAAGLVLGLVSFVLFMANSYWRSVLERGPAGLLWRDVELSRRRQLEEYLDSERPDLVKLRLATRRQNAAGWWNRLRSARQQAPPGSGVGETVAKDLLTDFEELARSRHSGRAIPFTRLNQILTSLEKELKLKNASELPALDEIHVRFLDIAEFAYRAAETEFARVQGQLWTRFPAEDSRTTGSILGNLTRAGEDYFHRRYGMSIEVFWPLVESVAATDKDRTILDALDEAKTRVDFTVSMNAMLVLYTAVWVIVGVSMRAASAWVLIIGFLGGIGALVFYRLTVWNTHVFQTWVRSAVELYRFDVLAKLHVGLPTDHDEEVVVWRTLTRLSELGDGNVTFKHP